MRHLLLKLRVRRWTLGMESRPRIPRWNQQKMTVIPSVYHPDESLALGEDFIRTI
ncbi:hypothetical protein SAMN05444161_5593 [Rhizobiales bacterium GAS191]|nr:hypothetical protein SAMN05444161_5593 [Rhizobiales bacterium GAS191]